MWKIATYPNTFFNDRYLINELGQVKDSKTGKMLTDKPYIDSQGYLYVFMCTYGNPKSYYKNGKKSLMFQVHRLVANTFIGNVKGKIVHHKNRKKFDNSLENLQILTQAEHAALHKEDLTVRDVLKPKDVHKICKLLEEGKLTYKEIVKRIGIDGLKVSTVEKIATGKNWRDISKDYDIKTKKRSGMNQFKNKEVQIGCMYYCGIKPKEICRRLGYSTDAKTVDALAHCAKRYRSNYEQGIYGLFTNKEAEDLCNNANQQQSSTEVFNPDEASRRLQNKLIEKDGYAIVRAKSRKGSFEIYLDLDDAKTYIGHIYVKSIKGTSMVKYTKSHFLAYLIMDCPETPKYEIKYINGNTLDLRKANLSISVNEISYKNDHSWECSTTIERIPETYFWEITE